MSDPSSTPLLSVEDLTVEFRQGGQWLPVVQGVSFEAARGKTLALVGESGSGKTVSATAVLGLTNRRGGRVSSGSIRFDGTDLVGLPERDLRRYRGDRISMIFQQPIRSLDPAFTVGEQIAESARAHMGLSRRAAWARAVEMLDKVRIPDAERRARDYPHTFSGGMAQRVMIASALCCNPELLIADEPTTALDVTVQAQILELLQEIQADTGVSILFISHDLAVVAEIADWVVVMYAGEIVESNTSEQIYLHPAHPYTAGLLASIPRVGAGRRLEAIPGRIPVSSEWTAGCRFEPRCSYGQPHCTSVHPQPVTLDPGHGALCHRAKELDLHGVPGA